MMSNPKSYHQPLLQHYGNLTELTAGGSGVRVEGSGGMDMSGPMNMGATMSPRV